MDYKPTELLCPWDFPAKNAGLGYHFLLQGINGNPFLLIDRKQNIAELAKNCTSDHARFKAELERAKSVGATLVILVEQNRYKDRDKWIRVETIEDLMLWESPHTTIRGEKVYRVLRAWMAKYPIRVEFCDRRQTGARILEIIYGNEKTL